MKRWFALLLMVCLLAGSLPAFAEKWDPAPAEGYDFDFVIRLHPEAFDGGDEEKLQGYAELLSALRFTGSLTKAQAGDNFDLRLSVIPVSCPENAISLRFFGWQDLVYIESSLFGDKIIRLTMSSLLNFCSKMSEHLGIPLHYAALLYPYTWQYALGWPLEDWRWVIGEEKGTGAVPEEAVQFLWDCWNYRVYSDEPLKILVDALCKDTEMEDSFRAFVNEIPDYFVKDFAEEKSILILREADKTVWTNWKGDVFFTDYLGDQATGAATSLPVMKCGYQPVFSYEKTTTENGYFSTRMMAQILGQEEGQQDLLNLKMSLVSFPQTWPADCFSLLSLDLTGGLLPNVGVSCYVVGEKNGHVQVQIRKPTVDMEPGAVMLTLEGELLPMENARLLDLELESEEGVLDLLVSNDVKLQNFLPGIMEPMAKGMLYFLMGIPTSGCQVVMDYLTETGILNALVGE